MKTNPKGTPMTLIDEALPKAEKILSELMCDFAEIRLSAALSTSISLSGETIDSFSSGESVAGSVRVLNKGAWSFVSFNDLENLEKFVKDGSRLTSQMKVNDPSGIMPYKTIKKTFTTRVERDFRNISIDEKFELIRAYNDILRSSEKIQTTRATYYDLSSELAYLNTEGSVLRNNKSYCGVSLVSIAKDGAVIQPFHNSISGFGGFEKVTNLEETAEEVVKTAVDLLSAESAPGGNFDIITDQKLSGVFIHEAFGHLSEADFIHENERLKNIMTLGRQFGPSELNVYDDGTLMDYSGYIPFDDEGILPQKTALISEGILSGRLHSRETACKMDEDLTGNGRAINVMRQPIVRMTNTYIENGPFTKDDIFSSLDNGIYAVDVIGGQTNLEMFTFTSGYGYEIKDGKKGRLFKDIVLSGNVFNTLKEINMIGNDREMFGGLGGCGKGGQSPLPVSFGGPHMLIKNVLIGGKQ